MNNQSKIYTGFIEEIIYENGKPTLNVRVRVPDIHDFGNNSLPKEKLPIASPMIVPGTVIDTTLLMNYLQKSSKVFVIFESGSYNNPVYFGIKASSTDGAYLDSNDIGPGPTPVTGDALVGTVTVYTTVTPGNAPVTIDGYRVDFTTVRSTTALVMTGTPSTSGVYTLLANKTWLRTKELNIDEVYSVDKGNDYGGTLIKVIGLTNQGLVVKNSEKFNPIMKSTTPTEQEIYKHDGVWFEIISQS